MLVLEQSLNETINYCGSKLNLRGLIIINYVIPTLDRAKIRTRRRDPNCSSSRPFCRALALRAPPASRSGPESSSGRSSRSRPRGTPTCPPKNDQASRCNNRYKSLEHCP